MPISQDGPASPHFKPFTLRSVYTHQLSDLPADAVTPAVLDNREYAPLGRMVAYGIPFRVGTAKQENVIYLQDEPVEMKTRGRKARFLIFLHTADAHLIDWREDGFVTAPRGSGGLREHLANYVVTYSDGTEETIEIRRRHQIGAFIRGWGENCFECVVHAKPRPILPADDQIRQGVVPDNIWGFSQTRTTTRDLPRWTNWVFPWQNPHPDKGIKSIRFEPVAGGVFIFGVTGGDTKTNPVVWQSRRKCRLTLPEGVTFDKRTDQNGQFSQLQMDLGVIIEVEPHFEYPNAEWEETYGNKVPTRNTREYLVEYAAHPEACFHFHKKEVACLPAAEVQSAPAQIEEFSFAPVKPAEKRVRFRAVDKESGKPVAVKLHVHGEADEYLAPEDRHRYPNHEWFEDYSADFVHQGIHRCCYIDGETMLKLPLGQVYMEVSKGYEIEPVRRTFTVDGNTDEIVVELEKVLPWREKGWVTADTHVHFLSPQTARLEGAAEGVNIINLLASQWGELMTNVGDFDGKTTIGSKEAGGDGEWLVRVGTENRQHILGHISLLGYNGNIISPMCTGGSEESALGDPIEVLLTEWAEQCIAQDGVVIMPHWPNPRCENAATVVSGNAHGTEMTSWGNLYFGCDPYSLSDWYRFLNCGYFTAAVGGTDKMSASTPVGAIRTYARIPDGEEFTYDAWKDAIRRGETFVSFGPLMDFAVEGKPAGSRIELPSSGGTVDVTWKVASIMAPMSRLDVIVNGEIRHSTSLDPREDEGQVSLRIEKSSWVALLIRGGYEDQRVAIQAHSSPVMLPVENSPFFAAADAMTILEQIEGAMAYLDVLGTRAEQEVYQRMRLKLTSIHRELHNRMHQENIFHDHSPVGEHHHPHHEKH